MGCVKGQGDGTLVPSRHMSPSPLTLTGLLVGSGSRQPWIEQKGHALPLAFMEAFTLSWALSPVHSLSGEKLPYYNPESPSASQAIDLQRHLCLLSVLVFSFC